MSESAEPEADPEPEAASAAGAEPAAEPDPAPKHPAPPCDPLAVGLGNASLFGVGYLLLARWRLALVSWLITGALILVLAIAVRTVWFELVVVGWWVLLIAHGYYLARKSRETTHETDTEQPSSAGSTSPAQRRPVRLQRSIALAVTIPILLVIGLLRIDSALIDSHTSAARNNGTCAQAHTIAHRLWAGDYVGDAPTADRGANTVRTCARLLPVADQLRNALSTKQNVDDINAELRSGFTGLSAILRELPGHERIVTTVLNAFLHQLPTTDSCGTATITDWLGSRIADGTVLDRSTAVIPRLAPAAILQCADEFMTLSNYQQALQRYQQLLSQYPGDPLTGKAKQGVTKATQAIQLGNVRQLLEPGVGLPAYCSNPAPYSGAAPYRGGHGPNHALLFTADDSTASYSGMFPNVWRANGPADAVVIICADKSSFGASARTCGYTAQSTGIHADVTFSDISVPIRAYELRTGHEITSTTLDIGGTSCPSFFDFFSFPGSGPPPQRYVAPTDATVHSAFDSLINP